MAVHTTTAVATASPPEGWAASAARCLRPCNVSGSEGVEEVEGESSGVSQGPRGRPCTPAAEASAVGGQASASSLRSNAPRNSGTAWFGPPGLPQHNLPSPRPGHPAPPPSPHLT